MRAFKSIWMREMKKYFRNRAEFLSTLFMSVIFLFLFLWAQEAGRPILEAQGINLESLMVAGIAISSVFMGAFSSMLSIINDKSTGFMKEFLISPIRRSTIVFAKLSSTVLIALVPAIVLFVITPGLGLGYSFMDYAQLIVICLLTSFVSSAIGMAIAVSVKSAGGFQAITSLLTMPMMFLSGAYIPLSSFPSPIQVIAYFNPLTYLTAIIRNVGPNGKLPHDVKEAQFLIIKWGDYQVETWLMYLIVVAIAAVLMLLVLRAFAKIDVSNSTKIDLSGV